MNGICIGKTVGWYLKRKRFRTQNTLINNLCLQGRGIVAVNNGNINQFAAFSPFTILGCHNKTQTTDIRIGRCTIEQTGIFFKGEPSWQVTPVQTSHGKGQGRRLIDTDEHAFAQGIGKSCILYGDRDGRDTAGGQGSRRIACRRIGAGQRTDKMLPSCG